MSEFIKHFKELNYKDVSIAGGKGASLGEMIKATIPVPRGFVILANTFDKFLDKTDLGVEVNSIINQINHKDISSVESASVKIRDLIDDVGFPEDIADEIGKEFSKLKTKYVAVRSSATAEDSSVASWAGELESYLNITKDNLLDNVKKCWASLFTTRAIFYRFDKKLTKHKVSVAVIVQQMVQSEIAGVCFTAHPVTNDKNQMVIEAGYGLGEAIVSGIINPDTYIINKKNWKVLDINISQQDIMIVQTSNGTDKVGVLKSKQKKQKLTDLQIVKLARLCDKIEKHYEKYQDIEWAFAKDKFYIVQSRPITTL